MPDLSHETSGSSHSSSWMFQTTFSLEMDTSFWFGLCLHLHLKTSELQSHVHINKASLCGETHSWFWDEDCGGRLIQEDAWSWSILGLWREPRIGLRDKSWFAYWSKTTYIRPVQDQSLVGPRPVSNMHGNQWCAPVCFTRLDVPLEHFSRAGRHCYTSLHEMPLKHG